MIQQPGLKEENLLSSIWLHPRATFHFILGNCPQKHLLPLLILGSFTNVAIRRVITGEYGNVGSTSSLVSSTLTGIFLGFAAYLMLAVLLSYTGRLLGGKASPSAIISILAWSMVPTIFSLALFLPHWILVGDEIFRPAPDPNSMVGLIGFLFTGIQAGLLLWSVALIVSGISVVQRFTIKKSILNLFVPGLFMVCLFIVIFGGVSH